MSDLFKCDHADAGACSFCYTAKVREIERLTAENENLAERLKQAFLDDGCYEAEAIEFVSMAREKERK